MTKSTNVEVVVHCVYEADPWLDETSNLIAVFADKNKALAFVEECEEKESKRKKPSWQGYDMNYYISTTTVLTDVEGHFEKVCTHKK